MKRCSSNWPCTNARSGADDSATCCVTYGAAGGTDEGRKSLAEERATLIDETMLAGEQLDFPALATETFDLAPSVFCWSAFCGSASVENLRLARDAAHPKLQVKCGRVKQETPFSVMHFT